YGEANQRKQRRGDRGQRPQTCRIHHTRSVRKMDRCRTSWDADREQAVEKRKGGRMQIACACRPTGAVHFSNNESTRGREAIEGDVDGPFRADDGDGGRLQASETGDISA